MPLLFILGAPRALLAAALVAQALQQVHPQRANFSHLPHAPLGGAAALAARAARPRRRG